MRVSLFNAILFTIGVQEFQSLQKKALSDGCGCRLLEALTVAADAHMIASTASSDATRRPPGILASPEKLFSFILLTYANLKEHKFTYWFCFPVLTSSAKITSLPANAHIAFETPPTDTSNSTPASVSSVDSRLVLPRRLHAEDAADLSMIKAMHDGFSTYS
jgi:hypothetical protein